MRPYDCYADTTDANHNTSIQGLGIYLDLFTILKQKTIYVDESIVIGKKYHESSVIAYSVAGRRAVMPAGEWIIPVSCMTRVVAATDSDRPIQRKDL